MFEQKFGLLREQDAVWGSKLQKQPWQQVIR